MKFLLTYYFSLIIFAIDVFHGSVPKGGGWLALCLLHKTHLVSICVFKSRNQTASIYSSASHVELSRFN